MDPADKRHVRRSHRVRIRFDFESRVLRKQNPKAVSVHVIAQQIREFGGHATMPSARWLATNEAAAQELRHFSRSLNPLKLLGRKEMRD